MVTLRYVGIGAQATPAVVLADMTETAGLAGADQLASVKRLGGRRRYRVRSVGAGRAEDAVLPWRATKGT